MFDEDLWEPAGGPAEPFAPQPQPEPKPEPQQAAAPKGTPMYEPPPAPTQPIPGPGVQTGPMPEAGPRGSSQYEYYEPAAFVPPQDDYATSPPWVSAPPAGRHYGMYRQMPTWQHASIEGLGQSDALSSLWQSLATNLVAIAAGAGIAYYITADPKTAAAGALAMIGAVQLPNMLSGNVMVRALIIAGSWGGAYYLTRDRSGLLEKMARRNALERAYANEGDEDDEEDDDEDEDESVFDENEDDDEAEPGNGHGGRPSPDPYEPAKSAPWMRPVVLG